MKAKSSEAIYLDSSVVLRVLLGERGEIKNINKYTTGISSQLLRVECLRTIDRMRIARKLNDDEVVACHEELNKFLRHINLVDLNAMVLNMATLPLPTQLGTLDAIHLCTARLWSAKFDQKLVFATHDKALGNAAKVMDFEVIGV